MSGVPLVLSPLLVGDQQPRVRPGLLRLGGGCRPEQDEEYQQKPLNGNY